MSSYSFSTRRHAILLLIVLILGSLVVYVIVDYIDKSESANRRSQLESVNNRASIEFSESLDRFVYLMSGIRAYLKHVKDFPSQEELYSFINNQLDELNYSDSLIISYIDQNHIFRYSFTSTEIDPSDLIGSSVREIRDAASMARIDAAMKAEGFQMFSATNLVEGWVGIPLHFSIVRDGDLVGYIAAIINFKAIIDPVYNLESSNEFVFRFAIDGKEFDRERAYDGSIVTHERQDSLYYKNYEIAEDDYVFTEFSRYGLTFKIGTAYIYDGKSQNINLLLYGWYVMIMVFVSYSLYRLVRFQQLNNTLKESVDTIEFQKTKLDIQNAELNKLNATKDKFFSIIGHDLKGPLTSISSIVNLWNRKSVDEEQTDDIMAKLGDATLGASKLLDNLLQWSLVNTGQIKWNPQNLSVSELLDEVFFQLGASATSKDVKLVKQIDNDIELNGDRDMISTILRNLVSNAIKFSAASSEVKVSAFDKVDSMIIEVIDQGDGLTEEERNTLFRLGDGPKSTSGTGLGLILVKEFVTRHKGSVQVESEKGKGTTFKLSFPKANNSDS